MDFGFPRQKKSHSANLTTKRAGGHDKPAWYLFAESRGGHIMVTVNAGQYIFIFLGLLQWLVGEAKREGLDAIPSSQLKKPLCVFSDRNAGL